VNRLALSDHLPEPPDGAGKLLGSLRFAIQLNDEIDRIRGGISRLVRVCIQELDSLGLHAEAGQRESAEQQEPKAHESIMQRSIRFRS
jgi:hypothetical protein